MNEHDVRRVLEEEGVPAFRGVGAGLLAERLARAAPPGWTEDDLRQLVRMYLRPGDRNATVRPPALVEALGPVRWRQFDRLLGAAGYTLRELELPANFRPPSGAPPQYDGEFAAPAIVDDIFPVMQRYRVGVRDIVMQFDRRDLPEPPRPPCIWDTIFNTTAPRTGRIVLWPPDEPELVGSIVCPPGRHLQFREGLGLLLEAPAPNYAILVRSVKEMPVILGAFYAPGNLHNPRRMFALVATGDNAFLDAVGVVLEYSRREGLEGWTVIAANTDRGNAGDITELLDRLGGDDGVGLNTEHCTVYESGGATLTLGFLGDGRWGEVLDPLAFGASPIPPPGSLRGWDPSDSDHDSDDDDSDDDADEGFESDDGFESDSGDESEEESESDADGDSDEDDPAEPYSGS